jgi:hypothetical protein
MTALWDRLAGSVVFIIAGELKTENTMDPVHEIGIEQWVLPGRHYPSLLPEELARFYCYTRDGGHSVIVILENEVMPGEDPVRFAVPAPVRMVLQSGWVMRRGWPWCQLPYDRDNGLIVGEGDVEY